MYMTQCATCPSTLIKGGIIINQCEWDGGTGGGGGPHFLGQSCSLHIFPKSDLYSNNR